MRNFLRFFETIINWLHGKLTARQFLIFSSIMVAVTAGLAAVFLKVVVHYIHRAITHDYHFSYQYIVYLLFPAVGILLSVWFVQKYLNGKLGRGTANVLHAVAKKSGFLPQDQMYDCAGAEMESHHQRAKSKRQSYPSACLVDLLCDLIVLGRVLTL